MPSAGDRVLSPEPTRAIPLSPGRPDELSPTTPSGEHLFGVKLGLPGWTDGPSTFDGRAIPPIFISIKSRIRDKCGTDVREMAYRPENSGIFDETHLYV
jgi:hypothetical protein